MIIKSLYIEKFKNIHKRSLDELSPDRNEFVQDNGWGKSNTIDAIIWLFTDKLKNGSSDIQSIKSHPIKNELMPKDEPRVSTVIASTDKGKITKTYSEIWQKVRGSNEKILKGHETRYWIDDVEYTQSNFYTELSLRLKMPLSYIPILMLPTYFGISLDMKERRKLISEMVGDISHEEVLERYPEIEMARKIFENNETRFDIINKAIKQELTAKRALEKTLQDQIKAFDSVIINATNISELKQQASAVKRDIAELDYKISQINRQQSKEELLAKREALRAEYSQVVLMKFTLPKPELIKCTNCGYELDRERYTASMKSYVEQYDAFESSKKSKLESITNQGKAINQQLEKSTPIKLTDDEQKKYNELKAKEAELDGVIYKMMGSQSAVIAQKQKANELNEVQKRLLYLEQQSDLLDMYQERWLAIFNERVKEKFGDSGLSFQLFDYTLGGELKEKCDMLDDRTPYEKTNTASQIKLGIKLIDAIKQTKNFDDMPILIDNAEAIVDKTFITSSQLIMMSAGKAN